MNQFWVVLKDPCIRGKVANVWKTHSFDIREKIFANFVCKSLKMSEVAA